MCLQNKTISILRLTKNSPYLWFLFRFQNIKRNGIIMLTGLNFYKVPLFICTRSQPWDSDILGQEFCRQAESLHKPSFSSKLQGKKIAVENMNTCFRIFFQNAYAEDCLLHSIIQF